MLGRADGVEDLVRDQTFVPANIRGVRRRPAAPKRKRPVSATTTSAPAQIHAAPAPAPAAPADAAFSAFMDEMRELPEPGKS